MSTSRLFQSLFTSGLFVSLCAVALAFETCVIANVPHERAGFYVFVFFATWSSYRVHAIARSRDRRQFSGTFALLFASLISACWLRVAMLPWVALAALLAATYSLPALPGRRSLREFGLLKILVLTGVWTLVTAYLPAQGKLDAETMAFLVGRRFLFMFALCLAFDVRDHVADGEAGIRTMPVRLGVSGSYALMRLTLLGFAGIVLLAPLVSYTRHPAHLVTIALLLSAFVTWLAIEASRRARSSLFYLGWVDGMMAMQSVMVGVAAWLSATR